MPPDGLTVIGGSRVAGAGSLIQGFEIASFRNGIALLGNPNDFQQGNNTIQGNFIGVSSDGQVGPRLRQNAGFGILVQDSPGDTIGAWTNLPPALAGGRGNVISNNRSSGIAVQNVQSTVDLQCIIVGNFIGTTGTGTRQAGNGGSGVGINASGDLVQNNTISGNETNGVAIYGGTMNTVNTNFIGTDRSGTKKLGNGTDGVYTNAGATIQDNLISGNGQDGVLLGSSCQNAIVTGNLIGTDQTGSVALGNGGDGVHLLAASTNTVTRNLISANGYVSGGCGVFIDHGANNTLQGNFIGTDATGSQIVSGNPFVKRGVPLGNQQDGVRIVDSSDNNIGGAESGQGNLISGNGLNGISVIGFRRDGEPDQGELHRHRQERDFRLGEPGRGSGASGWRE